MDTSKATPRPWHYQEHGSFYGWLVGPSEETVFHVDAGDNTWMEEPDALFVLEAVNSYDRLKRIERLAEELAFLVEKLSFLFGRPCEHERPMQNSLLKARELKSELEKGV